MNSMKLRKFYPITLATAAAAGVTVLALSFGSATQASIVADDPPPTSTTSPAPDGIGWGHG